MLRFARILNVEAREIRTYIGSGIGGKPTNLIGI